MTSSGTCPECGAVIPARAPLGLCPKCAFGRAAADNKGGPSDEERAPAPQQPGQAPGLPRILGNYELLEPIGQGGMGVVYKARQLSLNRIVAVKLLTSGALASQEGVHRFRTEAVAAGSLQHPNIIAVHEVGLAEGQHYLVMDYVAGPTLTDRVRDGPLPAPRAAQLLRTIAETVHFAHEHGILHRDLKPSNVLLDASEQPRVTDFGLAKRLSDATLANSRSAHTLSGQVLGSPGFMPPEQASAQQEQVSRRSDVYALGAILYFLLTGRAPFIGEGILDLLDQVAHQEPLTLRALNPAVPLDLQTICLKSLEKEPGRRYPTAQALAEELGRYLRGEPILARPLGRLGKGWRWCRRRPVRATLATALVLTFVLGSGGVLWQWRRAEKERITAQTHELLVRRHAYAADMNLAQRAVDANDLGLALSLLNRHRPPREGQVSARGAQRLNDLRHWEWRYLWQFCQSDELLTLCRYPTFVGTLQASAEGNLLALRKGDGHVALWDWAARRPLRELPVSLRAGSLRSKDIAFSPRGSLLALGNVESSGTVQVVFWDTLAGTEQDRFSHDAPIGSLAFSPDGKLLAIFDDRGQVTVVEVQSKQERVRLRASIPRSSHSGVVLFSPDGQHLAIGDNDGRIRVVQTQTGVEREIPQAVAASGINALAWSPVQPLLASTGGYESKSIRLANPLTGEPVGELKGHTDWIAALVFSPDGEFLASASADQSIRLWRVADHTLVRRFQGHLDEVWAVAFLPDGKTLVSADKEGSVRFWSLSASQRRVGHEVLPERVKALAFAAGGRRFLTLSSEGAVRAWNTAPLRQMERLDWLGTNNSAFAWSADGRWVATGSQKGGVRIWDWPARYVLTNLPTPGAPVVDMRFSPRGSFLLVASAGEQGLLGRGWRTGTWEEIPISQLDVNGLSCVCVAPDEKRFASGYTSGKVMLWKLPSFQVVGSLAAHSLSVEGLAFAPDARTLVSAGVDGFVNTWDMSTQSSLARFRAHRNAARGPAFSPDGKRFVTAGGNDQEAVKLWDPAICRELLTLSTQGFYFVYSTFSPDGDTLAVIDNTGQVHLWHAPSFAEIAAVERAEASPQ